MNEDTTKDTKSGATLTRKAAKGFGYAVAAVVGLVLLFLVLLLIPPVRGKILSEAISRANANLPGTLSVQQSSWSLPVTVGFGNLLWVDGPDTLLAAESLRVSVRALPLLSRDVKISYILAEGLTADVPSIKKRFERPELKTKQEPAPSASTERRFPREGSVPGIPSIAVEKFSLRAEALRVSETTQLLEFEAGGAIELSFANPPGARLDRLALELQMEGGASESVVDDASFELDMDRGMIKGRASGRISPELPFFLSIEPTGEDAFELVLTTSEGVRPLDEGVRTQNEVGRPSGEAGLALTGLIERSGHRVTSLRYEALVSTPGTEELSSIPSLAPRLQGIPPLEGLAVSLKGSLSLDPALAASLQAHIHSNSWIDGGRLHLAYENGVLAADTVLVRFPDLEARADGELSNMAVSAQAEVHITGTRWLKTFRPDVNAPDSLKADLMAEAGGARTSPGVKASLNAAARFGNFVLENLDLKAELPEGEDRSARLTFEAEAMDMAVTTDAVVNLSGDPTVTLSPVVLHDIAAQEALVSRGAGGQDAVSDARRESGGKPHAKSGKAATPGTVKYEREQGTLLIDNVRVTGDLGELRLDGKLNKQRPGSFGLGWSWPQPPASLARAISPAQMDSLRAAWSIETPFHIAVEGNLKPEAGANKLDAAGSLFLPGPQTLSALLPPDAEVDDMGPVRGEFRVATTSTQGGHEFDAALDLSSTEWIDFAQARVRGAEGVTSIDTLGIALEGAEIGASGRLKDGQWDALADLHVSNAKLIRRFNPAAGEGLEIEATAKAEFQGTLEEPRVAVSVEGSAAAPFYHLPKLLGDAVWNERGLAVKLDAPDGLATGPVNFNKITATYQSGGETTGTNLRSNDAGAAGVDADRAGPPGTGPARTGPEDDEARALLPGRVTLELLAPSLELSCAAGIDNPDGWHIRTDTLALALANGDLKNKTPFDFRIMPEKQMLAVTDLLLQGSLGRVEVDGYSCPDSCSLSASASVNLPAKPPFEGLPPGLWPAALDVQLSSMGASDVNAKASVTGIDIGNRRDLKAQLDLSSIQQGIGLRMTVADGSANLLEGDVSLPAKVSVYPPGGSLDKGEIRLDVALNDFPIPLHDPMSTTPGDPQRGAGLDGEITLGGTTEQPTGYASGQLSFPNWPEMSKYRLDFAAQLAPDSGQTSSPLPARSRTAPGAATTTGKSGRPALEAPGGPGLTGVFSLAGPGGELAKGSLSYPLVLTLTPPASRFIEGGEMDIRVDTGALQLAEFDDVLPPNIGLGGRCTFSFQAKGSTDNPSLDGRLAAENLRVSLENGTRVTSSGAIEFSGTKKHPSVDGELEIHNGVIRVPEKTKELHPTEGDATLWGFAGSSSTEQDQAASEQAEGDTPARSANLFPSGRAEEDRSGDAGVSSAGDASPRNLAEEVPSGGAEEDSTGGAGKAPSPRASTASAHQAPAGSGSDQKTVVDYDVTIDIPSGLWIRGQGMDVELAGELRLVQKGALPTISGDLQAVSGRLVFLGRTFQVERGRVVFYGGDEIDPSMDLVLSTSVEGTVIRILLGGTAHNPELNLTSEPEFPEGDIMSLLVFGRTMDELDNEQMNLLGRRAADMAAAFGAAQLEARLSQQLGVDLVTIGRGSGQEGGTSLVIGKYLSPKVLLKYEQALEERARFFVNLEYFLTRHFKIETLIGHQSQSAIEFNWTRDY